MRARNLKPGFFHNEDVAQCDLLARLLFAGLWCYADREGRFEWRPLKIKAEVLPYDNCDINELLNQLVTKELIGKYSVNGKDYGYVPNFVKHQKPHYKEAPSVIPPPPGIKDYLTAQRLTEKEREEIFERDGRKCTYCGKTEDLTIDHIIPGSLGGTNDPTNLQVLCRSCNSVKNNRLSSAQASAELGSTLNQSRLKTSAVRRPDSLIPDSLKEKEIYKEKENMKFFFLLENGKQFELTEEKLSEYKKTYRRINVGEELLKCIQWNIDNPGKRKTQSGILKHINRWLAEAQARKPELEAGIELAEKHLPSVSPEQMEKHKRRMAEIHGILDKRFGKEVPKGRSP
jgi:hypothetical protein